jgi:N,N'-diacetyllegionaminate synthase
MEIIAEIAQGFEGNEKLAELLAIGAIQSGADSVKYQLIIGDELCVPGYQYYDFFKSLEMSDSVWLKIIEMVKSKKKNFYFDVYGEISLETASRLGASGIKISTTDFYNRGLLRSAIGNFKDIFLSVGGIPIEDVEQMVKEIDFHDQQVTLMYGFQAEPTPVGENNLLRLERLRAKFPDFGIGFMDHSDGSSEEAFYLPLMAASLGVSCIEKHLTLDPLLEIEDYVSALEPSKFSKFVEIIKTMIPALGTQNFDLTDKEKEYRNKAGKVVVASRDIQPGEILKAADFNLKRVSTEFSNEWFIKIEDLVGKKIKQNISYNSPITKEMI